jgi:DNA-binding NtrC family response regulator
MSEAVLLVSSLAARRAALHDIFAGAGWRVAEAPSVAGTRSAFASAWMGVIVCDYPLADGTWREVLRAAQVLSPFSEVLVTSRLADERTWAEVLNLGAFDMLAQPFEATEVVRVACCALRQCRKKAGGTGGLRRSSPDRQFFEGAFS